MGKCKQCRMEEPNHKMDCSNRGKVTPETKVVLGRRFEYHSALRQWFCRLRHGKLVLTCDDGKPVHVSFEIAHATVVAFGVGPTESDAILALQAQLRKMAELEVE